MFLSLMAAAVFALTAFAQDGPGGPPYQDQGKAPDNRPNLLRQLGLSREQMEQVRRLNVERRPVMEAAQRRFREANRSLDQAIYADQVNEAEVQERIRETQLAQAELIKLRAMNEITIRRILTPDQLARFITLRQRFDAANANPARRPPPDGAMPVNNPGQRNFPPARGRQRQP